MIKNININQGFIFKYQVSDSSAMLIFIKPGYKYCIDTVIEENGNYYLYADVNTTKDFESGDYDYQIIGSADIIESGKLTVKLNFAYADESTQTQSSNRVILEAIKAQLAGRASTAQSSISVGDKSIGYASITELLKLKDYYQDLVDKEEGKISKNDGFNIKYKWSIR